MAFSGNDLPVFMVDGYAHPLLADYGRAAQVLVRSLKIVFRERPSVATAMAMVAMAVVATVAMSQYKTQPGRKDDEACGRVAAPHTATSLKASSREPRASDVFGEM